MRRLYILLSWRFSGISKLEREDFSRKLFNSFKQIFKLKAFLTFWFYAVSSIEFAEDKAS